jgi:hypothetical protein
MSDARNAPSRLSGQPSTPVARIAHLVAWIDRAVAEHATAS